MRKKHITMDVLEVLYRTKGLAAVIKSGKLVGFEEEARNEDGQENVSGACRSGSEKRVGKLRTEYKGLVDAASSQLYETLRKRTVG